MANALIKAMHQMSAYVCAHMHYAYMWVGGKREREQSVGEYARGHCECYIYLHYL